MASRLLFMNVFNVFRGHSTQVLNHSRQDIRRYAAAATAPRKANPETANTLSDTAEELNSTVIAKNSFTKAPDPIEKSSETLLDDVFSGDGTGSDWSKSYFGLSSEPFPKEVAEILQAPLDPKDVEIKPDGIVYLPEIKYRRILNKAFGPGGWGLAPRTRTTISPKIVSREYALVCLGRLVAVARGEQEYFDPANISVATEGSKSTALTRCCKDLGIASELWDPRFIREFKSKHCVEVFVEGVGNTNSKSSRKKFWRRRDQPAFSFPWKELSGTSK